MQFLRHIIQSSLLLAFMLWAVPAWAAEDLIDVLEIDDFTENPVIVHENILPGDSFSDTISVKNLKDVAFDIAMELEIDTSQGIWNFEDDKLEEAITIRIQRDDSSFVILPGPGDDTVATLQELDNTTIFLGSVAGDTTEVFTVLSSFDINAGNEYQNTKVYFNLDIGVEVVGESSRLLLRKFNDSITDETPGDEVVYTLEVTALGGDVDDVTVTDLPPAGFEYVAGSGEGAPFIHEYASPGIWNLGDMSEGETKTLTYKTKISGAQDAGLYKDIAFARGVSNGDTLFANSPDTPFVGTDVNVVLPLSDPTVALEEDEKEEKERKTKTKTQYVLGAATGLPLTGTPWKLALLGLFGVLFGWGLRALARKQVMRSNTLVLLLGIALSLGMPAMASAANVSVEIETPTTLVASPNFKIGFATLDVLTRPMSVACFTTGSAIPFATYALESSFGGNAGNCEVNGSVLTADGDYEFFVRATASGEGDETVESNHVTVTLASSFPGTPTNYDRDDDNCQAVIAFTTANDGGKTVKVELYRSEDNPFVANSSTKIAEQMLGSNANGSFTDTLPNCDEDIFYAIRSVDVYGRGSGFVGDIDVDINTVTVTKTNINTVVVPGAATGALAVNQGDAPALSLPAVQGAETTSPDDEESATGAASTETEGASVLGDMTMEKLGTWFDEHPLLTGLLAVVATILGFLAYTRFLRRRHDTETLS